jgi:hypothetical protein
MPQLNRFYCSNCKESIYNVKIDGQRVPIIHYIVTGQPDDTGPPFDVNGEGVKVTSFTREMMQAHVPVKRVELCEQCFAEIFGLKLHTAESDPMYSAAQEAETAKVVTAAQQDVELQAVDRHAITVERPFLAIKVGRGARKAPKLPKAPKPATARDPRAVPAKSA